MHGVSEQSFYRWRKVYGSMEPSEARELKELREENVKLKRLVADLSLDKAMLQDVLQKKSETRQEARDGELPDESRRRGPEASVPLCSVASIDVLLPQSDGSVDGAAPTHARTRSRTPAIRLSAHLHAVATGRVGRWQAEVLSRLLRGKPGFET